MEVEEDRRGAQTLCATLEGDGVGHGTRARQAGRIARACIITDDNINDPLALTMTSQKLIAAVALLRFMPEPATPEGRNLRLEAQTLVEQAALQQIESSASRMRQSSTRGGESMREGRTSVHTPQRSEEARASPMGE